jgi:drug/metabolite transporter superfamily protein YnfA
MSLVHTIAACIRANRQHGLALTLKINEVYVSGFVALGPLLVLFAASLPPLRGRAYEVFYGVHIVMAVFFLGALFWHGYKLLDSE